MQLEKNKLEKMIELSNRNHVEALREAMYKKMWTQNIHKHYCENKSIGTGFTNQDIPHQDKQRLEEIVRTSVENKEKLIIEFINGIDLNRLINSREMLEAFCLFAQEKKEKEIEKIIKEEGLKEQAKHFIEEAIVKGSMDTYVHKLVEAMPPISRMSGAWNKQFNIISSKINALAKIFQDI